MDALTPVSRIVCQRGIPLLRDLPLLRALPGVRGLCDIRTLDFPGQDAARFRLAVNLDTAAFIAPNHPEFFTDWMLDKELSARFAPSMASWATHYIVNGSGQWFWLRNNLIAQIPGSAGQQGKDYSVEWALQGHGVLLHPEGQVGWHGDTIGPLFGGTAELALRAQRISQERSLPRRVVIAPIVWKLRLERDAEPNLLQETAYVEKRLGLPDGDHQDLALRLCTIVLQLLAREEQRCGMAADPLGPFAERWHRLYRHCLEVLLGHEAETWQDVHPDLVLRHSERKYRHASPNHEQTPQQERTKQHLKALGWLALFAPRYLATPQLTQEHLAELIKRIRQQHCHGSLRDSLNRFVPRPAGPRTAHFAVPEPIFIDDFLAAHPTLADDAAKDVLTELLRIRLQDALDDLNARIGTKHSWRQYDNPFAPPPDCAQQAVLDSLATSRPST